MEWSVWSLKHVTRAHRDVIVILLAWNRFSNRVTDEIRKHTQEFGHMMKYRGVLVMPYAERMSEAIGEVLEKSWPDALAERIRHERYPFLLVIEEDFDTFDPGRNRAAFVWFSDFRQNEEPIWEVLDSIGRRIESGEDVIAYLNAIDAKSRAGGFRERLAGLAKYVDVSVPVIPGVISWRPALSGLTSCQIEQFRAPLVISPVLREVIVRPRSAIPALAGGRGRRVSRGAP